MFKNKKRLIWILIILAIIVGAVFYFRSKKPVKEFTLQDVRRGELAQTVSVTGKLVSQNQADLAFKSSGKVRSVAVEVGDQVKKGQRIAQLDLSTLGEDLNQAAIDIEYQDEILDDMKDNHATYGRERREAQKELIKKAEAARRSVQIRIGETVLYSPLSGIVTARSVEPGEIATAGVAAFTVMQEGEMEIESNIPESDIINVKLGQKAQVIFDALSADETFLAEVVKINPASTVIQDVVYYTIKLKLEKLDPRLKPGMSEDVDIRTAFKDDVLLIPLRAIRNENGKKYVEILKDEKTQLTEKVQVETGLEGDDGMVEAKSGVQAGDKVITFTKV